MAAGKPIVAAFEELEATIIVISIYMYAYKTI